MRERLRPPGRLGAVLSGPIGWFLTRVYWRTKIKGADAVPGKGPVVIIANHVGFIDGPVAVGITPRPSHYLVKKEMFKHGLGLILRASGQIEVEGTGREALVRAKAVLDRGGVMGVFPEGTRGTGDASSVAGGAAWLALHGNAPVVPLALFGTRRTGESVNIWPRPGRKLLAIFGRPFTLDVPQGLTGRERRKFSEEMVAKALQDHVRICEAQSDIPLPSDDQSEGQAP
ncbi:MAG: 1-acyl-sn-glycerol-3-phosphate acyltransferase [Demequinaceae bacterium]|nr:1-acyl-sn-glycerol-3-phosphate acyltransferase [Demequinaceae bacterium]